VIINIIIKIRLVSKKVNGKDFYGFISKDKAFMVTIIKYLKIEFTEVKDLITHLIYENLYQNDILWLFI